MIRIGLLGYGTVGQAFAELVARQTRVQTRIEVALVRDPERPRKGPQIRLTGNPEDVIDCPDIDVIVDVMGGSEPARQWLVRAIEQNKSVISANKEVMADYASELGQLAARHNVYLAWEAAVGGGIPLLEPLKSHFSGAPVSRFIGILNGTTNYVLSRLETGESYSEALSDAQRAGYAEADPANDLNGSDVARKLELVFGALFGTPKNFSITPRRGIDEDLPRIVKRVEPWGWRVKVLAVADQLGGTQIWPTLVRADHRLAQVTGVMNVAGVEIYGQWFWMEGPGAGGPATALSLLADFYRGYETGFHQLRLSPLAEKLVHPISMPWIGFALDPDRSLSTFNVPDGAILHQDYCMTPPLDQISAANWLAENPGLLAYPVLLDA